MLNFFNNNIRPLSDELAELLDDKVRADARIEEDEAKALKAEQDCDD